MNRGDRREVIFEYDEDRERLLQTLTGALARTVWQVHAYCLMRNHFHSAGGPAVGEWGIVKDSVAGTRAALDA